MATEMSRWDKDPDPAGPLINWLPASIIQDYGSPGPEEIFTDLQHWLLSVPLMDLDTATIKALRQSSKFWTIFVGELQIHMELEVGCKVKGLKTRFLIFERTYFSFLNTLPT